MIMTKHSVFAVASELKVLNELLHVDGRRLFHVEDSNLSMKYGKNGLYTKLINPYNINCLMKNKKNFNQIWDFLIKKKLLYVSDIMPKKWFTVDNINNFIELKNIK